tara:strand:- start:3466 stop:3882 length:417 start_codon:yes stop_codon:yes gene_type:complete
MKNVILITLILSNALVYSQDPNKRIGDLSIFSEPSEDQLELWSQFDKFLVETYNYIKFEKNQLETKDVNPFKDSIFVNEFNEVTYRVIYDSAKGFKDSLFFKDPNVKNYKNINEWAQIKYPLFMKFNKAFNRYLDKKN